MDSLHVRIRHAGTSRLDASQKRGPWSRILDGRFAPQNYVQDCGGRLDSPEHGQQTRREQPLAGSIKFQNGVQESLGDGQGNHSNGQHLVRLLGIIGMLTRTSYLSHLDCKAWPVSEHRINDPPNAGERHYRGYPVHHDGMHALSHRRNCRPRFISVLNASYMNHS